MNYMLLFNALQSIFNAPNAQFGVGVLGPLEPLLVQYLHITPDNLTTGNQVVIGAWGTVLAIADAFFFLLILIGAMQTMLAQNTGSLTLSVSEFVPRILVTGLLMNLSFFFGRTLLQFNNLLCGEINANLDAFFTMLNAGTRITVGQGLVLSIAVIVLLNIGLLRLLFQALERLVLWNLLFVLSPLAFLCTFLPHTSSIFGYWGRMFVVLTFTQFVQFLALALALALLSGAGQTGLAGYLMTIAMLFLVAKVPDLLARFASMGTSNAQGVGRLVGSMLLAARLLVA